MGGVRTQHLAAVVAVAFGVVVGVAVALGVGVGVVACDRAGGADADGGACPCAETAARPVDRALVAWLSKARSLHHAADLAEAEDATERALAPLDELASGPLPPGAHVPGAVAEVDDVLADTRARAAEIRSRRGDHEGAERDVAAGLARARGATYFRGHLLEVRGLVLERRAKALETEGRRAEAAGARAEAVRASLEAVRIQDEVIRRTLGAAPQDAAAGREGP